MSSMAGFDDSSPGRAEVDKGVEALLNALVVDLDAGFSDLFVRYERVVWVVAQRLTRVPAEAEDLAADAFLRAYRALRGYDEVRIRSLHLRSWLFTILRNTARNRARDSARRPASASESETVEQFDPAASVERQVEQHDAHDQLARLMTQLPDTRRLAVVLRHVVGCSTAEIGEALGCPEGTAKSHVSRGMERLRALALDSGKAG